MQGCKYRGLGLLCAKHGDDGTSGYYIETSETGLWVTRASAITLATVGLGPLTAVRSKKHAYEGALKDAAISKRYTQYAIRGRHLTRRQDYMPSTAAGSLQVKAGLSCLCCYNSRADNDQNNYECNTVLLYPKPLQICLHLSVDKRVARNCYAIPPQSSSHCKITAMCGYVGILSFVLCNSRDDTRQRDMKAKDFSTRVGLDR